jgi:hypothetical protein
MLAVNRRCRNLDPGSKADGVPIMKHAGSLLPLPPSAIADLATQAVSAGLPAHAPANLIGSFGRGPKTRMPQGIEQLLSHAGFATCASAALRHAWPPAYNRRHGPATTD